MALDIGLLYAALMRRFVLVLALVSTCCSSERSSSGSDAPSTRVERWDFNTPALDLYTGLDIRIVPTDAGASHGELIIDGHATGQQWSVRHPPRVLATGDGRQLLYGRVGLSAADMGLFVWEPERASLTALGEVGEIFCVEVPPLGTVFTRAALGGGVATIFELSPTQPRLEPIWQVERGAALIVGAHDGALLLLEQTKGSASLVSIHTRDRVDRRSVTLDGGTPLAEPGLVSFADGRLLLARKITINDTSPGTWALAFIDVDTGEIYQLGEVPGSWTATGMSWPAPPRAMFVDEFGEAHQDPGSCVTAVRRSDLELRTWCPPPEAG